MALFGRKKEKERCPVCGNEISFFSGIVVRDGTICSDCEKMLRGSFDIETYYVRRLNGTVKRKSEDPLNDMTIEQIKDMIDTQKEQQTRSVSEHGEDFAHLYVVQDYFTIAPKAVDVGLKRARAFKNKLVVRGMVQSGVFEQGDTVKNIRTGQELLILELIPCTGAVDFTTELHARIHKKTASVNTNAWMILDAEYGAADENDLLVKE